MTQLNPNYVLGAIVLLMVAGLAAIVTLELSGHGSDMIVIGHILDFLGPTVASLFVALQVGRVVKTLNGG